MTDDATEAVRVLHADCKDERYIPVIRRRLRDAATPLFDALDAEAAP